MTAPLPPPSSLTERRNRGTRRDYYPEPEYEDENDWRTAPLAQTPQAGYEQPQQTRYEPAQQLPGVRIPPRRPRKWWGDLAGTLALASMVVVVALWLANGGIQEMKATGGIAISLGRLTGLIAADLLILQVLLMARIPWVERAYGQDALARRHRLVGFTSFWLMMTHIVLIILGYAQQVDASLTDQTWNLITNYSGVLLATAGTVLLIAVVGLSIRAARRKLRYESWHLIHLYAYLGVGLALPHQLWIGKEFATSYYGQLYWVSFYGGTMAAVVIFRLALPIWRSHRHKLEVEAVVPEASGIISVYIRGEQLDRLPARAGQFFLWRFKDGRRGWTRSNPFSLSAMPRTDQLRITAKVVGDGTSRLATLRPGTKVYIEGPFGKMTGATRKQPKVLLMAAGVGITAMRALLEDLDYAEGDATLLYRVSGPRDVAFADELDELAWKRGARVIYVEGGRARRKSCMSAEFAHLDDSEALRRLVPDLAEHDAYLCGPPEWMDAGRTALRTAGIPANRIHIEEFAW